MANMFILSYDHNSIESQTFLDFLLLTGDDMTPEREKRAHIVQQFLEVLTSVDCGTNQASLVSEPISVCHDSFIDLFVLLMNPGCCVYLLVKNIQCTIWSSLLFSLSVGETPAYCVRIHHAAVVDRFDCHTLVKMPGSHKGWREHTRKAHTRTHKQKCRRRRSKVAK